MLLFPCGGKGYYTSTVEIKGETQLALVVIICQKEIKDVNYLNIHRYAVNMFIKYQTATLTLKEASLKTDFRLGQLLTVKELAVELTCQRLTNR